MIADVVVVGAKPVGGTVGGLIASAGFDVLIIEKNWLEHYFCPFQRNPFQSSVVGLSVNSMLYLGCTNTIM